MPTNVSYLTYADAPNPQAYPTTWVAESIADADPAPASPWVTVTYAAFQTIMATQQAEYAARVAARAEAIVDDVHGPDVVNEWIEDWTSPTVAGRMGWASVVSGIGALTQMNTTIKEPNCNGIVELRTGTVVGGRACLALNQNSVVLGGGVMAMKMRVRISALADGSNKWLGKVGLGDDTSGFGHADEVSVGFDYDLYGGNWHLKLTNGATAATTTVNLSVAPVADTWTKITIIVNDVASGIKVYIDDTLRTTYFNPAYISRGSGRAMGPYLAVSKALGLSLRTMYADYCGFRYSFSPLR